MKKWLAKLLRTWAHKLHPNGKPNRKRRAKKAQADAPTLPGFTETTAGTQEDRQRKHQPFEYD